MNIQPTKLEKITGYVSAGTFCFWLQEHPEVNNIQGFTITRTNLGMPSAFMGGGYRYSLDAGYLYDERKMINDWIDRYINDPTLKAQY